jgi:hypothetical protein
MRAVLFSVVRFSASLASGEIEVPPRVSPRALHERFALPKMQRCCDGKHGAFKTKDVVAQCDVDIWCFFCLMIFVVLLMHC